MDESPHVYFKAEVSKSEYCTCDCCNATERVIRLEYPVTKYFLRKDGKRPLTTKYKHLWLCNHCYRQMLGALLNPEIE